MHLGPMVEGQIAIVGGVPLQKGVRPLHGQVTCRLQRLSHFTQLVNVQQVVLYEHLWKAW